MLFRSLQDVGVQLLDVLEFLDEVREDGRADAVGLALGPSIGWLAEGDLAIEEEFDSVQLV